LDYGEHIQRDTSSGRNPDTGESWGDEAINRKARRKGQLSPPFPPCDYRFFDRAAFINERFNRGLPCVITWVPNYLRLHCREHRDIYGIPDIVGIEEIPTLFSGIKGMERFRVFLIPYLLTGYDIPEELERDEERLVPFTARDIEIMNEMKLMG
jgi:hypothetical protein